MYARQSVHELIAILVTLLKLLVAPRALHMTTPERDRMCSCCFCHLVSLHLPTATELPMLTCICAASAETVCGPA